MVEADKMEEEEEKKEEAVDVKTTPGEKSADLL